MCVLFCGPAPTRTYLGQTPRRESLYGTPQGGIIDLVLYGINKRGIENEIRPKTAHPVPRNMRTSCMVITAFVLALFYSVPVLADRAAANASQPLTLDECVDIALSKNPEIAQARYVRDKARFYTHEARAGYFPEVNLNSTAGISPKLWSPARTPLPFRPGRGNPLCHTGPGNPDR